MATSVTVPGSQGTIVSQNFSTTNNIALAQAIQAQLVGLLGSGTLNTQTYGGGNTPAPVEGATNELIIPPGSGAVAVPPGWNYVVDLGTPLILISHRTSRRKPAVL